MHNQIQIGNGPESICYNPQEKGMFEDVDVEFQAHLCQKFDFHVFEHIPFSLGSSHVDGTFFQVLIQKCNSLHKNGVL